MKARWKSTEEEVSEVNAALKFRETLEASDREWAFPPGPAHDTIEGAARWAVGVLWQDRPVFLCAGVFCLAAVLARMLIEIVS